MRNIYLDYFRFSAFVLMFVYHFVISDHIFFASGSYLQYETFYELIGSFARNLFILTSGFSLYYSRNSFPFSKLKSRFFTLLICSLLISLFSYLLFPQYFIFNGIIHFFTFASVVNFLFLKLPTVYKYLVFAINIVASLFILPEISSPYLIFHILGFSGLKLSTLDFFPFLPWYNLIMLGYFTAPFIDYLNKCIPLKSNFITKIGSKSLKAYMVHPLFLILLFYIFRSAL